MLNDCKYNKIKLLHELSCMAWFLEKHAVPNAQDSGEGECVEIFKTLKNDLDKHIANLERDLRDKVNFVS